MNRTDLIAAIRAHAIKNYEKDGWDVLVECYSDEDISAKIGRASTLRGAIWKLGQNLRTYDSHRREIEATAF